MNKYLTLIKQKSKIKPIFYNTVIIHAFSAYIEKNQANNNQISQKGG